MTAAVLMLLTLGQTSDVADMSWEGHGPIRMIVHVEPSKDARGSRADERPAEVVINFSELLSQVDSVDRRPDLTTIQVIRHDPATGTAMRQGRFAYAKSPNDIPWRWYDASIGYEFPEVLADMNTMKGDLQYVLRTRLGYFYDCIGDWREGHFAFIHRDDDPQGAWYGIYFDLLPAGAEPAAVPPRGWLGDGMNRCAPSGGSTTGLIHARVDVVDFNDDGLFDLLVGCSRGGMVWYPNRGEPGKPYFPYSRLIFTADGKPLDVGWTSAPRAVDWDGDGLIDLLSAAEWNRVVLYRNRGPKGDPVLEFAGVLQTEDGLPLNVPYTPSPETEPQFKYFRDYYPILEVVDWDGDGDKDVLAGGYVTGRIYLFENLTDKPDDEPRLRFCGPIEADGKPLDVIWAAAPTVADLDQDGDLDLITGCMPVTEKGGDASSSEHFLHYYRNEGTRTQQRLTEVGLPRKGQFPNASLATPRLIDWSNDGLLDLVVSAGTNIYLYRNTGTATEPIFDAHPDPLPSVWGSAGLSANQFLDWNGDSLVDAVNAPHVSLNTGRGHPGVFEAPRSVLRDGQTISHLSGIGDDWRYQRLYDLDGDGLLDLMDADHGGHFWWHRNLGSADQPDIMTEGYRLLLTDGSPAVVGKGRTGFDELQGARATYTVGDFNADQRPDMVASDTFGNVWYFQQAAVAGDDSSPRFETPVQIGKLANRAAPSAADWNGDGRLDAIVASSSDNVFVFLGRDSARGAPFEEARKIALPTAPFGAGGPIAVADFNHDGDQDILLSTAYGYYCWYEHSFIESGYARGRVKSVQRRR